jgi:Rieske Fe-S protein
MDAEVTRRAAVAGVSVAALAGVAGCTRYGGPTSPGEDGATEAPAAEGTVLGKAADVPVGGGAVFADQKIVVTQAAKGEFKGFSAVCKHQGCIVSTVDGGTINCTSPCGHGSKYKLDGSVANGPAAEPLDAATVSVNADGELVAGEADAPPSETEDAAAPGIASTDEIPVGGGKVFKDKQVVITQPAKGQFKGFSAVCKHQGCIVDNVGGGTINCECHGSKYKLDGSVANGPAAQPLDTKKVQVDGDQIRLT